MDCCEVPWQPVPLFSDAVAEGGKEGGEDTEFINNTHIFILPSHTATPHKHTFILHAKPCGAVEIFFLKKVALGEENIR